MPKRVSYEQGFLCKANGFEIGIKFPKRFWLNSRNPASLESEEVCLESFRAVARCVKSFTDSVGEALDSGLNEYQAFEILETCLNAAALKIREMDPEN